MLGMLRRLRIAEYNFFLQNNCIYSNYVLFKIQRIGFRQIGTEPLQPQNFGLRTSLLQQSQLESLEERRKVQWLAFMYKILNDLVAVPAASVDLILSSRPSRGTRVQVKT